MCRVSGNEAAVHHNVMEQQVDTVREQLVNTEKRLAATGHVCGGDQNQS